MKAYMEQVMHDHRQDPGLGAEGDGRHGGEHSFGHVRGYRRFPERLPNEDDRRGAVRAHHVAHDERDTVLRREPEQVGLRGALEAPSQIDIYPDNFEDKQQVIAILDDYNDRMVASGQDDKKVSYTDFVGTLMKSVTTIVDMISYVLIAFVAISLVVSSIMIGIITYISVLERKKEIGILRAIGASKGRHLAGVQRRDHHRGPDGGPYRRGGRGARMHSGPTPLCTGLWTCRHRHAAAGGWSDPRGHQACSCRCRRPVSPRWPPPAKDPVEAPALGSGATHAMRRRAKGLRRW